MINWVACGQCGEDFDKDQPWKKLCIGCWIKNKREQEAKDDRAKEKIEAEARAKSYAEWNNKHRAAQQKEVIPQEILAKIIRLCHPDKHSNSTTANEVTQWLLKQRK